MSKSTPPPKQDQELIKACLKGKRSGQKELYDKYAPKMFGICLRYAKNYHLAEDLLQEGFIKVYRNLGGFKGTGSFEGWMRRIFVNTAIEHYRKNNLLYSVSEPTEAEAGPVENGAMENLSAADLMKLVNDLSDGYRMVFNLYAIEGYTHKEIGAMLGISEGTSKSQLARARNILKQKVQTYYPSAYEAHVR
jgi:RNA polymerase sigma-70 factor (ECF subfamily)